MLDDSSELVPLEELSDLLSSLLVSELDPLLLSEPSSELDSLLLPEPSSELPPSLEEFSLDESLLSSSLLELELVLDFLLLLRTQQKHFQQDLCISCLNKYILVCNRDQNGIKQSTDLLRADEGIKLTINSFYFS